MNVLADMHHSGLFFSLHLLFKKRLGWKLYRPIGEEWFTQGYWDIAKPYKNNPATIKQYLAITPEYQPKDGSPPLNTITSSESSYYEVKELAHDYTQKAITFQQFLDMDIDIIIGSIPDHWITYRRLRDQCKPKAKLISQMGNMFNEVYELVRDGIVQNLMASTIPFNVHCNNVFYHQEQPDFPFHPISNKAIKSFVHLLPKHELWTSYKHELSEYEWKAYGAGCPNGWINGLAGVYEEVTNSTWGYHVKPRGDGYGWVWHTFFLIGRPVITSFSDYRDKLGGLLFEDGITGIDLERGTIQENCERIRKADIDIMSQAAYKRFREIVNYNEEETKLRQFMADLI